MNDKRLTSGPPIFGIIFVLIGIVLMSQGPRRFDTIDRIGGNNIVNIAPPMYFAISGGTFILSGSILIGLHYFGDRNPPDRTFWLGVLFFIYGMFYILRAPAGFDHETFGNLNIERTMYFVITGSALILSGSLLIGLYHLAFKINKRLPPD
jgi:hypothetical protein